MNRVLVVCVLVIVLFGSILFSTTMAINKNNSPERMRKLRAIKKKKAEERNRAQMKVA